MDKTADRPAALARTEGSFSAGTRVKILSHSPQGVEVAPECAPDTVLTVDHKAIVFLRRRVTP